MRPTWVVAGVLVIGVGAVALLTGAPAWTIIAIVVVGAASLGAGLVARAKTVDDAEWEYEEAHEVGERQRPGAVSPRPGKGR